MRLNSCSYLSAALQIRRAEKIAVSQSFAARKAAQDEYKEKAKDFDMPPDELDEVFAA
jgi:hypothetical protein